MQGDEIERLCEGREKVWEWWVEGRRGIVGGMGGVDWVLEGVQGVGKEGGYCRHAVFARDEETNGESLVGERMGQEGIRGGWEEVAEGWPKWGSKRV